MPAFVALRERVKRAMLATLLFCAHGTPMLLAGDEFGRTQQGNNNAYCQDNEISWVDWTRPRAPRQRGAAAFHAAPDRVAPRFAGPALRRISARHGRSCLPGIARYRLVRRAGDVS